MRITPQEGPSDALAEWAIEHARGTTVATPPGDWEGTGPNIFIAWREGVPYRRFVGFNGLVEDARAAAEALADTPESDQVTLEVSVGEAPLVLGLPYVRELSLVPLHEGLIAELEVDGERKRRVLSPEELRAEGAYDRGIPTPIPDLGLGTDVLSLAGRMARDMGVERETLLARGTVRRFRSQTYGTATYPRETPVTTETLRTASREAADFLLRHQDGSGQYTYVYDGRTGRPMQQGYNIPRHSGTTYFLAQVGRVIDHAPARQGAIRALEWIARGSLAQCGDNLCIQDQGHVDVGSAALTMVAAAEVLMDGEHPRARELLDGLSAFLRAQQRPDGELMHEFDLAAGEPIDVQHLYYSGEAAFALLRAYKAGGDERNLEAAQRLMAHLTGASWDFLGSRYYYGEEHWTCIAAGEAHEDLPDEAALDFCRRWYEWNDELQFREGQTPWPVEGGYGVGPVVVPRLTPVGSRSEAFIGTYLMMRDAGLDTAGVRGVVERGLRQLLRYRWAPGPTHLLADPAGAHGAVPGSPVDLSARNDFTQHAGSSWIRWLEVLEEEAGYDTSDSDGTEGGPVDTEGGAH